MVRADPMNRGSLSENTIDRHKHILDGNINILFSSLRKSVNLSSTCIPELRGKLPVIVLPVILPKRHHGGTTSVQLQEPYGEVCPEQVDL